ncbi:MAG: glycosyltransferase [Alphaproteobacteria bacterium]
MNSGASDLRLLQAIAGGEHGGAEAFFVRLTIALARAGVDQHVLVRRGRPWLADLRAGGLHPLALRFGGSADFTTRSAFGREIKSFSPHVVMTWMNRASHYCPASVAGRSFTHVARLGGYYDLKYYRSCDHLIGNTEDIVRYVRDKSWPAAQSHYIPNFVSAEPAPAVSRTALETPERAPLVLALGRLHVNKAFDVLLRALAELPDTYVWIAGEGPLRNELQSLAQSLGVESRLRLLGWREDVAALLSAADILVCPSRTEPLGNVVIEAWAHGTPVVAAAAAGPMSLVTPGETGLLVPLEDAPALATSIRTLIDSPELAARLGEAGRAAYAETYTEAAIVRRYLNFFEEVRA